MNKFFCTVFIFFSIFVFGQQYPVTKLVPNKTTKFSVSIEDNYKWLENSNSDEVKEWVEKQNEFSKPHLQEVVKEYSVASKVKEYDALSTNSLPSKRGKYFYSKYRKDKTLPSSLYYRKDLNDFPIELFNPFKVLNDKNSFITSYYPAKNSKYIAIEISMGGSDMRKVLFTDIDNLKNIDDVLENVKFSNIVWNFDRGVYYKKNANKIATAKDSTFQIFYHAIGSKQVDDKLVYDATKTDGRVSFFKAEDKLFIIEENSKGKNYKTIRLETDTYSNVENIIENDTTNFEFRHYKKNKFYFSSKEFDWGEVRYFDINNKDEQKVIISQIYNHLLEDTDFLDEYIICKYRTTEKRYLSVYDYDGQFIRKFDAPDGFDFDIKLFNKETSDLYVTFSSYVVPYQNFKLNLKTGEVKQYYNDYIKPKPTIFPLDYFITKTTTFVSRDGKDVPITIVYKKGIKLDGNNPTLLKAYGGYGAISGPYFDSGLLYFLDKGGVFAYAGIRGGGEKGLKWHRDGKGLKKINSFNDFIDAAEYLIKDGYTSPAKLGITGGSNGGLLVGAALTLRPDLFKVAIPIVGVFDMLNFDSFTAGKYWVNEYGNSEKEGDFKNLLSYSPYHAVNDQTNYPTTLILTGNNDDRVVPFHSYKFAAKLQNAKGQKNPIYLSTSLDSGHNGKVSNYKDYVEEKALFYSFLLYHLNH